MSKKKKGKRNGVSFWLFIDQGGWLILHFHFVANKRQPSKSSPCFSTRKIPIMWGLEDASDYYDERVHPPFLLSIYYLTVVST